MKRTLSLFLLVAFGITLHAKELTLSDVKRALKNSGAKWEATESQMTSLSSEEKKMRFGLNLPAHYEDYFTDLEPKGVGYRGEVLDWRNKDGVNYVSPVLDQGRCGSCVAFASVATFETQMNIAHGLGYSPWSFSPQHLFSCGGAACEQGWQLGSAASFLKETGIPDEACFPYASGALGKDMSCSQTCSNAAARSVKISSYSTPTFFFVSIDAIKEAVRKGPVMAAMMVYDDFMFYKNGVYKHVTGNLAGGHAVSIVGFDENQRYWIVRNSWGESWGENGYFRISWDDNSTALGRQSVAMEVEPLGGYVNMGDLKDRQVLSGVVSVKITSSYSGTEKMDYNLTQFNSRAQIHSMVDGAEIQSMDTTQVSDGVYTLVARAHHEGTVSESQPRIVHVLNGQLTGNLNFLTIKEGDSLKGVVKMNFSVASQPVPFSKVTFYAKSKSTGELTVRSTTNVGSEMQLSWRTTGVPDGNYQIWLEGTAGEQRIQSNALNVSVKQR